MTTTVCFLILAFLAPFSSLLSSENHPDTSQSAQPSLQEALSVKINEVIAHSKKIPGFTEVGFSGLRDSIQNAWNALSQKGVLEITGTDKEVRPYFVALQGVIEHVLSTELQRHVGTLNGFIHTPMPATPLCTKGEISPDLVDRTIEMDPKRLLTVKVRTTIIRDYLFQGGSLYIVYPRLGLSKRTSEQQKIYSEELSNYSSHLFDIPLDVDEIPSSLIGATYLFKDRLGRLFVFAIKMTQANSPQDTGNFGLWFGSIEQPAIREKVNTLAQFLENHGFALFKGMVSSQSQSEK